MAEQYRPHSIFFGSANQLVLINGMSIGLRCRQKPCTHHDTVCTKTQGRYKASRISDPSSRQNQCGADRIYDTRHQCHSGNCTRHVATSLDALRDYDINTCATRSNCRLDRADLMKHGESSPMGGCDKF